jgi:hypothetical protein
MATGYLAGGSLGVYEPLRSALPAVRPNRVRLKARRAVE